MTCPVLIVFLHSRTALLKKKQKTVTFHLKVSANGDLLGYDEFIQSYPKPADPHTHARALPCLILTLSYLLIGKADRRREG